MEAEKIEFQTEAEWLKFKKGGIGGSNCSATTGTVLVQIDGEPEVRDATRSTETVKSKTVAGSRPGGFVSWPIFGVLTLN